MLENDYVIELDRVTKPKIEPNGRHKLGLIRKRLIRALSLCEGQPSLDELCYLFGRAFGGSAWLWRTSAFNCGLGNLDPDYKRFCALVAGNQQTLDRGIPLQPQPYVSTEDWIMVEIVDWRYAFIESAGTEGFKLRFRIMTGPCAGLLFAKGWPEGYAVVLGKRSLGLRSRDNLVLPSMLVGCYACVLATQSRYDYQVAWFRYMQATSAMKHYNRAIYDNNLQRFTREEQNA